MNEPSTEVQNWADPAMFAAEGHEDWDETTGVVPKVHLLWMTPDPLGAVAAMSKMYKGEVVRDLHKLSDAERVEEWDNAINTKFTAPLEAVKLHFMFDGVDRAFTHQHVRQRTAVYAQESLRFAVIEDLIRGTSLPPVLHGSELSGVAEDFVKDRSLRRMFDSTRFGLLSDQDRQRAIWDYVTRTISEGYSLLVNQGMPQEDARGLLPHSTATRINYVTDLANLVGHAGNRLCTQAQFHWRLVFTEIVNAIRDYRPDDFGWVGGDHSSFGTAARPMLREEWFEEFGWQFATIAKSKLFRPACYQLGKCPFKAEFDRSCTIRERVEVRAKHGGTDPEQWHKPFLYHDPKTGDPVTSEGINPLEWAMDPTAARRG